MLVDVICEDPRWAPLDLPSRATEAARATLSHLGLAGPVEIALLAADDARIAVLNGEFRGKPVPTNVLSWPAEDLSPQEAGAVPDLPQSAAFGEPLALGDIALAYETCAGEAIAAEKPLTDHVSHLIVHAILHLLGYDHQTDLDASLMEAVEIEILAKLGVVSPYAE